MGGVSRKVSRIHSRKLMGRGQTNESLEGYAFTLSVEVTGRQAED